VAYRPDALSLKHETLLAEYFHRFRLSRLKIKFESGYDSVPELRILDLLPALPKAWPTGSVTGFCARGGFEVDLAWKDGGLTSAVIRSKLGNPCLVRYNGHQMELKTAAGKACAFNAQLRAIAGK
jgi:hypothetical protein